LVQKIIYQKILLEKLRNLNINVFGPNNEGANLESSKEFMKEFCKSHDIPTAKSNTFLDFDSAKDYLEKNDGPIVVKYDGLLQVKVFLYVKIKEAIAACSKIFIEKYFQ
jgi:phosphoribosylamine--glycine ligase